MSQFVISASYGNDSTAMIQWAAEAGLKSVTVVYCNTGWAAPGWWQKVETGEALARSHGYATVQLTSIGMTELVRIKDGFPGNGQQFCTAHLKGIPFLEWIDSVDPAGSSMVMIGKRREESAARARTEEYVHGSEYHGGRTVWHPLYLHTEGQRNALLSRAGIPVLPHRSKECSPCVNANRSDFLSLTPGEIERVSSLEVEIARPMFRPKRYGALGIHGVIKWAKEGKPLATIEDEESQCAGLFGCGI